MIGNIVEKIMTIGNWLAKLVYLQILWIVFTILGLVAFGIMPATTAMFYVIRKWIEKDPNIPIFDTFYKSYRADFLKSNGLGIALIGIGIFLYYDYTISKLEIGIPVLHFLIMVISFFYFIFLLYFFPVFARYNMKPFEQFRKSFYLSISRPLETFAMIISFVPLYFFFNLFPFFFVVAGAPLIAFPSMWFANRAFMQIEGRNS
ncbi:DUF624 domain-containing protein [Sporosarcina sp. ANT_H38]